MSEEEIRIMKTASCPSLSERSTLSYEIGCLGDSLFIRLSGNTGKGIYSKAWIALSQITPLQNGDDTPITAKILREAFKGKSVNTVGFLIAALIAEGLLKVSEGSLRCYDRVPAEEYQKILKSYYETIDPSQKKPAKAKNTDALVKQKLQ